MSFNSLEFLVFFPIATAGYFLLPQRVRWAWLLAASCAFYMFFKPIYILILAFTILIDYAAAIWMENTANPKRKTWLLSASIVANVGMLAFFKYYNFLNENVSGLATLLGLRNPIPFLNILLPIGLSFHTFQAMSYTIEVWRGEQKAERHLGIYALYVMFFPQLVAGPIERPQNLLHQFHEKHALNFDDAASGLRLMLWGFFKKVVVADRAAVLVNRIVDTPSSHNGLTLLIAAYFFAFQIYGDFSGYSDIAIGAARVLGIRLTRNFDRPFISQNVTEFWRRWHISLSTWFSDYLFNPLWTSIRAWGTTALVISLFVTFFVSGLWHGANWTYVFWGGLNGLAVIYEALTRRLRGAIADSLPGSVHSLLSVFLTFNFSCFAWVFFRARTFGNALSVLRKIAAVSGWRLDIADLGGMPRLLLSISLIVVLLAAEHLQSKPAMNENFHGWPTPMRWGLYYAMIVAVLTIGIHENIQFIYFQF